MSSSKGFSLVELAVALAIITLLLAGALIPLSAQIDVRNVGDTQRSMESIREAIVGFAQANGRLPCPANGTTAAGGVNAGAEQYVAPNCTATAGVVPWATLGVAETDSWGRRFSYWVSPIFADAVGTTFGCTPAPVPTPTQSSFALCSLGTLTVNTRNENTHAATAVGLVLPAVIISHGKNGSGAFTACSITPCSTLAAPAGADEIANATHTAAATTFVSRTQTPRASTCDDAAGPAFCEFDDVVVMITSNLLIARMVAAGRLP
jgi:prepilin-type N-terminal cleavage/methylation domain-containing protein